MDIPTGAINTLLTRLVELVAGEYKLQKGVKGEIKELEEELTSMEAALRKVSEVPPDQLDEQVKIWARDVRELSYDIEDKVDVFMLSSKQEHQHTKPVSLKGLTGKYKKARTNHKIHYVIKDIMDQVKKVAERRDRYKVDNIAARPAMVDVDPRLEGMYRKATELVGIDRPKDELAKRLLEQDYSSPSRRQSNIISIVGFGGLGKTTLANSLLQDPKLRFDHRIFVSVSLNPDINKIFKNILLKLDEKKYSHINEGWEVNLLIDKIKEFLKDKKCLCVIDDLWKESAWDAIKLAFQDGHPGTKIIVTTRKRTIAEHVGGGVYELKPLSDDDSRKLLNKRIFDTDDGCPASLGEVTGKILKKCGGVPLAIITTASLLASKPMCLEEWEKVNKSIGSGLGNSLDVDKMRKILSLSYNDLPFHLKTCLLSLSKYPEDQVIRKDVLVWNWIAEGFITGETQQLARTSLREIGENYFNELINRSLIQPVPVTRVVNSRYADETEIGVEVPACQVHDMVLELINQLSAEEGFVTTILSEDGQQESTLVTMQKRKIRRLSLHNNSIKSYAVSLEASKEHLSKVRSLDIFGKVKSIPPLSSFRVLRVLQVDDCSHLHTNHLNDLGKLRLLRFLRLHGLNKSFTKLPESIGELESLETLDIRVANSWRQKFLLPVSFGKLGRLVRLLADVVKLPDGLTLKNMRSLRELVGILFTVHAMNEISELSELKVLTLVLGETLDFRFQGQLVANSFSSNQLLIPKCLQRLRSLQDFVLVVTQVTYDLDLMAEVPCSLQRFVSNQWYLSFPRWINPSLSCLTVLSVSLLDVHVLPDQLEKLAELPSLRFLRLCIESFNSKQELLVLPSGASAFPCLTELHFVCEIMFLQFQRRAVRKLQRLSFAFNPYVTNDWFPTNNNFDYGLENLHSLRHVVVQLYNNNECPRKNECREAEDAIRKAINDHPNHPSLRIC